MIRPGDTILIEAVLDDLDRRPAACGGERLVVETGHDVQVRVHVSHLFVVFRK